MGHTHISGTAYPTEVYFKFFRHASGPTGSATNSMNPNAALGTPSIYELVPTTGTHVILSRINFLIKDLNCSIGKFGGLAALTNGIKIEAINATGAVETDFLDSDTVKVNEDFDLLAGVDVAGIDNTKAVDAVPVRWTLTKGLNGQGLLLVPGSFLRITIQDNLSGLDSFRAMAHGCQTV